MAQKNLKRLVLTALLAALCCVATMVIKVPSPLQGYLNLGDGFVLLCGFTLSPLHAFLAAGLGSALADLFSGYLVYAPATFLIKGGMALLSWLLFRRCRKRMGFGLSVLLSGAAAEVLMVGGYYVFEGFLYGFVPSLVNIPANAVQGVAGILVAFFLQTVFQKYLKTLN